MPKHQPKAQAAQPEAVVAPVVEQSAVTEPEAPETKAEETEEVTATPVAETVVVQETAVETGPTVKGRVLRACVYGQCDDVVDIPAHQVEALAGVVDTHPDAVAYAESLKA